MDCRDRAIAVVKLQLRDAVEPGEKGIGRWRLWEAHRRGEAKRGRVSRHQILSIDRFERIAALSRAPRRGFTTSGLFNLASQPDGSNFEANSLEIKSTMIALYREGSHFAT
jgi:hypothetical protein